MGKGPQRERLGRNQIRPRQNASKKKKECTGEKRREKEGQLLGGRGGVLKGRVIVSESWEGRRALTERKRGS